MIRPRRMPPRDESPEALQPRFAAVVHAAAALYLGRGGRSLRDLLGVGFSLSDIAERYGQSAEGLKRAIVAAVRRTSGHEAPVVIDRILEVTKSDSMSWEATVDRLRATWRECGWRATAA